MTTNSGQNWVAVNNGLTYTTVYSLATNGSNIFAGTQKGYLFLLIMALTGQKQMVRLWQRLFHFLRTEIMFLPGLPDNTYIYQQIMALAGRRLKMDYRLILLNL